MGRGGKREGAGRRLAGEQKTTISIRIPISLKDKIEFEAKNKEKTITEIIINSVKKGF